MAITDNIQDNLGPLLLGLVLVLVDQNEFSNSSSSSLLFITNSKYSDLRV